MWTDHIGRASFAFGYEVRRVADGAGERDAEGAATGAAGAGTARLQSARRVR